MFRSALRLVLRLVLSGAVGLAGAAAWAAAPAAVTLEAAVSADGDTPEFPSGAPTREVTLPDRWSQSRPGVDAPLWYRVAFAAPAAPEQGEPLALSIERVCSNVEVWLNGRLVHRSGRLRPPYSNHCATPQLASLPAALIQPGLNVIDLKVVGHALDRVASATRAGGLSTLRIGPQADLAPRHERLEALQVGIPQGFGLALALAGVFLFVIGWFDRRVSLLAYFGVLCLGWAALTSRAWLRDLPWDDAVVEFVLASILPIVALAAVQFLLRHARLRERVADVGLPLQCVLVPLSLMAAGPARLHDAVLAWSALFVAEIALAAALNLAVHWRAHRRQFSGVLGLLVAFGLAEAAALALVRLDGPAVAAAAAQMLPAAILMGTALWLARQHGSATPRGDELRVELEQRLASATAEIEANYRQVSELRVEQVTERERKRIAADLHDDLGAKLLTIVHTSESERISTLAREALEEMRLSVRGLTGKPVRLEDAIGDWRAEVISRLSQASIEAEWNMPVDDLPQTLSARAFVQTTRILREAVSNIIKHSGASQCIVRCGVADGDFQLVIQDNGNGISLEVDGRLDRGHGMSSMKHRAKQLQGQCLVESGPGYGTVIRLTLPLGRAVEPA